MLRAPVAGSSIAKFEDAVDRLPMSDSFVHTADHNVGGCFAAGVRRNPPSFNGLLADVVGRQLGREIRGQSIVITESFLLQMRVAFAASCRGPDAIDWSMLPGRRNQVQTLRTGRETSSPDHCSR